MNSLWLRRRFDWLYRQIRVEVKDTAHKVSRYQLYLYMKELGMNPDNLSREHAVQFIREHLKSWLEERELAIGKWTLYFFASRALQYDPNTLTPEDHLERWDG